MTAEFLRALAELVDRDALHLGARLAPFTTFRVGGPADCLVQVRDASVLERIAALAHAHGVLLTVLGGGSNTVVSDSGVRGLVVRFHGGRISEEDDGCGPGGERGAPLPGGVRVRADAGVTMNALVRWTIARGDAGLEAWAGTPGTVGGAVFGNAHYGGRDIGERVASVRALAPGGDARDLAGAELRFSYDRSRFQDTPEIILSAQFALTGGADPARLREVARGSLAHRKRTQPLNLPSAGCIFQNPDPSREPVPDGIPPSAGALVDRAGLKGRSVGGARVSTAHANFIVNEGTATASDIRALVRLCQAEVRRQFGVALREEIRWLGEFGD